MLIAGMAQAVVVVEAQHRSGALNTAKWAKDMGIVVMALDSSPGARRLIQSGAGRVNNAEDILNILSGGDGVATTEMPEDPDQRAALALLGEGGRSIDEIARQLGWRVARAAAAVLRLELAGLVSSAPDGSFHAGPGLLP